MTPDQWSRLTDDQRAQHVALHGPPPPGWAYAAAAPATKTRRWPAVLLTLAVVFVLGIGCSVNRGASGPQSTVNGGAAGTSAAAAPARPAGPANAVADGTYEVGKDMVPGRYKTPGPQGNSPLDFCYWERTKDDSGDFDAIISNDVFKGPGSVTVKSGEFVKVSGGCAWTKQ